MKRNILIIRNLRYHFRGNLAVLLGTAVGAAVLTGALLVGDSLRGSLRFRTDRQLDGIDNVLVGTRLFRDVLAQKLPGQVHGALMLEAAVHAGDPASELSAGKVAVWGIDDRFVLHQPDLSGNEPIAILSSGLAAKLGVKPGEPIYLSLPKASVMPRSSLLSRRGIADSTRRVKLTVRSVLAPDDPANFLSLSNSPSLPINMFVPLARLQQEIDQPGRINALLASGQTSQQLQTALRTHLTLDDWNLKLQVPPSRRAYLSVESSRLLLEPATVAAVESTAQDMGLRHAATYTYLANSISHGKQEIPYSIVAALDPAAAPPLGPFLPPGVKELRKNDIVLVDWKDNPIQIQPGQPGPDITVAYFKPEVESRLEETSHRFRFGGFIPLAGVADDRFLTPDFPGITDKANLRSWSPPFPIDQQKIKPADERFWDKYRTTPKAYIRLDDGRELWGTRFGDTTSVRIAPSDSEPIATLREHFGKQLLGNLNPAADGLIFQPIRELMFEADRGSTDFGTLFLSFSSFLIVAALMLVGLLFRLNLERRAAEIGLIRAIGFPQQAIQRMLLTEGFLLAALGSLVGLVGAAAFADVLIGLLVDLWPTAGVESFLTLHATWQSFAIGYGASVVMSVAAIYLALRSLSKMQPVRLLKGDTPFATATTAYRPSKWPRRILAVSLVCAAILGASGPFLPAGEAQAGTFFGSGALLLTAAITLFWIWAKKPRREPINGRGVLALARLGSRNTTRNPVRSALTVSLVASAAFLLVAVESFRREPEADFLAKTGGSGGFNLVAEATTPLDFDPNDSEGREQIEEGLNRAYQDRGLSGPARENQVEQDLAALANVKLYRFRVQPGDDASCLNLCQAIQPRLFGVPTSIIERGGFSFAATLSHSENPWLQLEQTGESNEIPCIVEQNTAMWMLKKAIGDTIEMQDQDNRPLKLRIVALLKDSVFQSQVLISSSAFRKHFPRTEGFNFFLVETPDHKEQPASRILQTALSSYGLSVTPSVERVAQYLAVQNSYLTTFQLLGGFGLLLGILGLSVILLRNIWERRAELAVLRSVGYRKRALIELVVAENGILLIVGLLAGVTAALAAVAPHIASGTQLPWARLSTILGAVFGVGIVMALLTTIATLRAPLIPALRNE